MIEKDQPLIFGQTVATAISSISDGNMKYLSKGLEQLEVDANRAAFLRRLGISPDQTVLLMTTYEGNNYTRYKVVNDNHRGQGMVKPVQFSSDSLITSTKGVALFLPIADCVGAIMYDPLRRVLMLAHLGRQHTEQFGAKASVEFLANNFGSRPEDLLVWLGPAPGAKYYPLHSFNNRSLHEITGDHLKNAGIEPAKIAICGIDNAKSPNYFSHNQFLKGKRETDGRYAIVAMMR